MSSIEVDIVPGGDQFGQVRGGRLHIRGPLFEIPSLTDIMTPGDTGWLKCDEWEFVLDDYRQGYWGETSYFLPLVEAPDNDGLDLRGIILQRVKGTSDTEAFSRVGFAIVSEEDGCIAKSEWYCKHWAPRPWPESRLQTIILV